MSTVNRTLNDPNLLIKAALGAGVSVDSARKILRHHPTKQAHIRNIPPWQGLEIWPPVGDLTISIVRGYLIFLESCAQKSEQDLADFREDVLFDNGNKQVKGVMLSREHRSASIRFSTIKLIVNRLDEIMDEYEISFLELVRRLKEVHGGRLIGAEFSYPELVSNKCKTIDDMLFGATFGKPELRDYQKKIVDCFMRRLKSGETRQKMQIISLPTGAGKTLTANECADLFLQKNPDGHVLWLAPDWELLAQAALNMAKCFGRKDELGVVGKGIRWLKPYSRKDSEFKVIYTTLHSWHSADRSSLPNNKRPLMVVCDESHWGLNAKMLNSVFRTYLNMADLLGLTATPRVSDRTALLKPSPSFSELVGKYLAEPKVDHVYTGIQWQPIINPDFGTLTTQSLNCLGNSEQRNLLITKSIKEKLNSHERVLVYACNNHHADLLDNMLSKSGVPSAAIHSGRDQNQRSANIANFRNGSLKVLVSVNMFTHGLDVPEISLIVMARPTESATLCAQMIGRGARLIEGKKTEFNILEFTDNTPKHGPTIFHAKDALYDAVVSKGSGSGAQSKVNEWMVPDSVRTMLTNGIPGCEGLPYTVDHTFGVEIELTAKPSSSCEFIPSYDSDFWQKTANEIRQCISAGVNQTVVADDNNCYHEGDRSVWNVESDSSCGWEIISPPLRNNEGFVELYKVCLALQKLLASSEYLMINHRCGLHITLATKLKSGGELVRFACLLQLLEPGLFSLVRPSRLYQVRENGYDVSRNNEYCNPMRKSKIIDEEIIYPGAGKFTSVNVTKSKKGIYAGYNLVEVRMHHSTVDYAEILPWISLWMQIFNISRNLSESETINGSVFSGGNRKISLGRVKNEDIIELLESKGVHMSENLLKSIRDKRAKLRCLWEQALPRRVDSWANAGWYD